MTTTITPSNGNSPLFTQQGIGAAPGYDAMDLRRAVGFGLREGIQGAGAYAVTGSGTMSVNIAASSGWCVVQGDAVTNQGLYQVPPHSASIAETIAAAHATLPRIDRVIVELLDNAHDASGFNKAQTRVLTGTATAGATLANQTGVVAVPSNAMPLARILVPAASTSVSTSNIWDERPKSRGKSI